MLYRHYYLFLLTDMNKDIVESINFLLKEYERLKKKKEMKIITKSENETLIKLSNFLGKK